MRRDRPRPADARAGAVGDDVGHLGRAVAAVAFVDVLDDLLTQVGLDVDVDIGRPVPRRRQEPFEQQVERHGIGLGDAERKTHCAVCCTAATLTEDVVAFAELHDVPHHEEIAGETELLDHVELVGDLPLRLAEFTRLHRNERSGVLHGMTRVRSFAQDDSHIFCTKEQMAGELKSLLSFVLDLLRDELGALHDSLRCAIAHITNSCLMSEGNS